MSIIIDDSNREMFALREAEIVELNKLLKELRWPLSNVILWAHSGCEASANNLSDIDSAYHAMCQREVELLAKAHKQLG